MLGLARTLLVVSGLLAAPLLAGDMSGSPNGSDSLNTRADDRSKTWDSTQVKKFIKKAMNGGQMEVRLGEAAQQRASSLDVRDFARMMVTHHSEGNEKLKTSVQHLGITPLMNLEKKYQDKVDDLNKKTDNFDREYMKLMVKEHKDDVNEFEKAEKNLPDGALRTWVTNALTDLRNHLTQAEAIEKTLKR